MLKGRSSVLLLARRLGSTAASPSSKFNGKVGIVTASTSGIGLAVARRLLGEGAKVMISSRKPAHVQEALETLSKAGIPKDQFAGIQCHAAHKEDRTQMIQKTIDTFGGIDMLVSNAAVNPHVGPAIECPEAAWDKIFDLNVKAAFLLSQEVYPHLLNRKGGSITYISTVVAFQPLKGLGAYGVSKTALLGLTKVLAQELGPHNVRVNCVCPGIIKTRFSDVLTTSEELAHYMLDHLPLHRFGTPEDIAGLVTFLCSDDAAYITGENYVVAGGAPSRL